MPGQAYAMSGMGASFRPAGRCPVMNGPHCMPEDIVSFMVADAATRDRSAGVRIVLWRCRFCGTQMTGIGRLGEDADVQEFTWLEEAPVLPAAGPDTGRVSVADAAIAARATGGGIRSREVRPAFDEEAVA